MRTIEEKMDYECWLNRVENVDGLLGDKSQGFELVYGPWEALTSKLDVAFLSLNPGLAPENHPPRRICNPCGNNYELTQDAGNTRLTDEFLEMCRFLKVSPVKVLTGVLVPIRSKNAKEIDRTIWAKALVVGRSFWAETFQHHTPKLIVTCGGPVRDEIIEIVGGTQVQRISGPDLRWVGPDRQGSVSVRRYKNESGTTVVSLPHLSQWTLFTTERCRPALKEIFQM
jgi:hypothetical protein